MVTCMWLKVREDEVFQGSPGQTGLGSLFMCGRLMGRAAVRAVRRVPSPVGRGAGEGGV